MYTAWQPHYSTIFLVCQRIGSTSSVTGSLWHRLVEGKCVFWYIVSFSVSCGLCTLLWLPFLCCASASPSFNNQSIIIIILINHLYSACSTKCAHRRFTVNYYYYPWSIGLETIIYYHSPSAEHTSSAAYMALVELFNHTISFTARPGSTRQ